MFSILKHFTDNRHSLSILQHFTDNITHFFHSTTFHWQQIHTLSIQQHFTENRYTHNKSIQNFINNRHTPFPFIQNISDNKYIVFNKYNASLAIDTLLRCTHNFMDYRHRLFACIQCFTDNRHYFHHYHTILTIDTFFIHKHLTDNRQTIFAFYKTSLTIYKNSFHFATFH